MQTLGGSERIDIRNLLTVLIELYYAILSLNIKIYEHTKVKLKGYNVTLPLDLVRIALLLKRITLVLKEVWKIVYSPERVLIEELRISNTVEGRIDIPLTSRLLSQGIPLLASRRMRLTLESIENVFLKAFLERLRLDISEFVKNIDCFKCEDVVYEEVFRVFTENIRRELERISENIRMVCERTFLKHIKVKQSLTKDRAIMNLSWRVLERRSYPYNVIASIALEYVKTNILTVLTKYSKNAKEISSYRLGLWDYKLYEVYVYYVIAYAIARILRAQRIYMFGDEVILLSENLKVKVVYDKVPKCKSWIAHGKTITYSGDGVTIPAGRPDVTIQLEDKVVSVCDAKYRVSMRDLSECRFKVLGYMHEYNSKIGALIFDPTHINYSDIADEEVRENVKFLEEIIKYGGVVVEDKDKTLYIIPLKPKRPTELVESKDYKIIENMVEKSITKVNKHL